MLLPADDDAEEAAEEGELEQDEPIEYNQLPDK